MNAPQHRADVPVDACRHDRTSAPCGQCAVIDAIAPRVHRRDS